MVGTVDGSELTAGAAPGGEVTLVVVDPALRAQVLALAPHPPQRRWSGVPGDTLGPAERDPAQRPVAILLDGRPAGFLVLHGGVSAGRFVRPHGELLIRAFFVDATFQGRGVARRALALLPGFVRALDPTVTRLVLTVNVENEHAQRTYTRAGFVDTGARYQRPGGGPQLVLELPI
ncbi:GNAT family N-acetyltransferase [Conexibacter woesei]|uniref:GCN5-related N-acetyltransferase n=1 Tax=Conexibacter woesei (strain DSM 14684 / CCUG 47730 / CIP 108061 / JCM 11494 / NBRC 100937 / ID131577) TaxID=469383 RepID=D3FBM6_CONWI|nr:GNAT family N-acetyltransferase [Conexibacter woesei]ADB49395.1 GCN5-related N-acetyltransferase [Conexibacter woesei DSM 14684]